MTGLGILATVIFLLADGSPARKAWVFCQGVPVTEAGNDTETLLSNGRLILDSRGASIMGVDVEKTITCQAWQKGQSFNGSVHLRERQTTWVILK